MSRTLISLALAILSPVLSAGEIQIQLTKENEKSNLIRDAVVHLLEGMYDSEAGLPPEKEGLIHLDTAKLPKAFVEVLEQYKEPVRGATIYGWYKKTHKHFKTVTESYRQRSLELHHSDFTVPATLKELEEKTAFNDSQMHWKREVIAQSAVKGLTRVIYRSPGKGPKVSIAQTHLSDSGDLGSKVRETELIVKRAGSKQWDFYVYGENGELSMESAFLVGRSKDPVVGPVPLLCFTCHYDHENRLFVNQPFVFPQ